VVVTAATLPTQPSRPWQPAVRFEADRLVVDRLELTGAELLVGARRHIETAGEADLTGYLTGLVDLGAKASTLAAATVDLAAVESAVTRFTAGLHTTTETELARLTDAVSQATDPQRGAVSVAVNAALAGLADRVGALVAGEQAPVRTAVGDAVREVSGQTLAEVQRALAAQSDLVRRTVSPDSPTSPLHTLKAELLQGLADSHRQLAAQLAELRTGLQVETARAEAAASGPAHGRTFEQRTLDVLEALVHPAGDRIEATGTVTGQTPRSMKGDAVITLASHPAVGNRRLRIVVEAKDRQQPASAQRWAEELAAAKTNRRATGALAVLRSPEQMPGRRRVHVLDPLTLLVAHDPDVDGPDLLLAAVQLLRVQVIAAGLEEGRGHGVDLPALRKTLAQAGEELTGFDQLTRHVSSARRSLDDVDKAAGRLRAGLQDRLGRALALLEGHVS
jgi:hypothetical protein